MAVAHPIDEDPRIQRTRSVVLTSALHVVADRGFEGASIEAISAHSGVARSTIYRHWPQRQDLLLDAIEHLLLADIDFAFADLRTDLIATATALSLMLSSEPVGTVFATLIVEARRSDEVARLQERFIAQRMGIARRVVETAIASGQLSADTDPETVATLIVAPIVFRVLVQRDVAEPAWIETLVDRWLATTAAGEAHS